MTESEVSAEDMIEAIQTCVKHSELELNEWETNFLISMEGRSSYTPKMVDALQKMYDKT